MQNASSTYARSIFAYELACIAEYHGSKLADLKKAPISLDHKKVDALVASLSTVKRMPALNQGEIMSIIILLKLSEDERLRIYAALVALGTQRLLLEYLADERAWQIADEVRKAVLAWLRRQRTTGEDPFRRIRSMSLMRQVESDALADSMTAALDAYDEGTRLTTLGQLSEDKTIGSILLEQAHLCLLRAVKALENLTPSHQVTEEWVYWHQEVLRDLETVRSELE